MIRAGLHPVPVSGHRVARLALSLVLAGCAWSAHAQPSGEAAVMKRATALREAPGDSGRSVAELPAEAPVTRLAERQGPWIRVRDTQGRAGWVHLFDIGSPGSRSGGAASDALRSVTGFFNRDRNPRTTTATSTLGIRGLGAEKLAQSEPDIGAVGRMESLRQNETQARQFASESAIAPVQVESLPAPARARSDASEPGSAP